jgi:CRP-like cAMP-binding protein
MKTFLDRDPFDLGPFFSHCKSTYAEVGDLVCDSDSARRSVFLVRKGIVRCSILNSEGPERLTFYGSFGCLIGDTMCFGPKNDISDDLRAVAVTRCEIAKTSHSELKNHYANDPELALSLLRRAHAKVSILVEQLEYATFFDTTRQVAALLYALSAESKCCNFEHDSADLLQITHQTIAAATGRTRVSVTNALSRLRSIGAINLHRGRVEVVDEAALAQVARGAIEESAAQSPQYFASRLR